MTGTLARRLAAALILLALVLPARAEGVTRLMVVSDIHYLANPLYDGSDLFVRALRAGDGKLTQHGDTLLDALAGAVERERPDALLATGDLAFNGERESHEALAEWFAGIEATGVPVWVIPGNHDINVPTPRGFSDDGWYPVDGVTADEFAAIYADFTLPATAGANLSYAVDVGGLRVAMTDAAYYDGAAQTFGVYTAGHDAWLEGVARDAQASGQALLTASHHSLLAHTEFSKESYQMLGHEAMEATVRRWGGRLHLSGHLHIQHIVESDGLADIATGAFCTWPHRYAVVTLDGDSLAYEAKSLDEDLLPEGFLDMSRDWFAGIAEDKVRASLEGYRVSPEEVDAMAAFAARFNLAYFAGTCVRGDPAWQTDPAWALWRRCADNPFWQYMRLVMNEASDDNLRFAAGKE